MSQSQAAKPAKKKKGFSLPPLLFLMLGLILFMCILTYIVPAGNFAQDEAGNLIGDQYSRLGYQTPVNPWDALMMMLQGMQNSSLTISLLLVGGASVGVILDTGAIDDMINWAIYKLKDKGVAVLFPMMFFIMSFLGAFGGGDNFIALVPIGVVFAKKLRLDPIAAVIVIFYANMIGFSTGPTKLMIPQLLMDLPVYSGFGMRFMILTLMTFVGMFFAMRYVLKVAKDPSKSGMGNTDWMNELDDVDESAVSTEVPFKPSAALIVFLFFFQYVIIVVGMLQFNTGNAIMIAVQLPVAIICGLIARMPMAKINASFAKGAGGMAMVGVVIGFAGTMSLVMNTGQILHTIVYYASLPLQNLTKGFTAIGISIVVMCINVFIPSASSKAAILFPIVKPMAEALDLTPQVAVSSFQFGDGFTNMITPALGWTIGALEIAKVPYEKWLKWALPSILVMTGICWVILYFLANAGWTGL